jgi:hypothetical protein
MPGWRVVVLGRRLSRARGGDVEVGAVMRVDFPQ